MRSKKARFSNHGNTRPESVLYIPDLQVVTSQSFEDTCQHQSLSIQGIPDLFSHFLHHLLACIGGFAWFTSGVKIEWLTELSTLPWMKGDRVHPVVCNTVSKMVWCQQENSESNVHT